MPTSGIQVTVPVSEWQNSADHGIDYLKLDAGAPSGTPAAGEKCLNTSEAKLYEESGLSWDGGAAVSEGDRFIFKDTGTDGTGDSGTFTKNNNIYEYDGSSFDVYAPTAGATVKVGDESLAVYDFDGSVWSARSSGITVDQAAQLIAAAEAHHSERLARNSTTVFQIEAAEAGIQDFIVVNGETVSIATPKTCTVSGGGVHNLLAADGTDSTGQPQASTLYYAYVSNSLASFEPSEVRLSATSPTNGYLGAGNGAHWRFVGAVYLDGSVQIAEDWNLCGFGVDIVEERLLSDITRSSGSGDFDVFPAWSNVITLPNTVLMVFAEVLNRYNVNYQSISKLYVGGGGPKSHKDQSGFANNTSSQAHFYTEKLAAITNQSIQLRYAYAGNSSIVFGHATTGYTFLRIIRTTL